MASELDTEPAELEELREERCCGVDGWEGARRAGAGAMVSPSVPSLSPIRVLSLPESTTLPHAEQYRLVSGISVEHEGQRMTSGDCITAAACSLSTGLPDYSAGEVATEGQWDKTGTSGAADCG